MAGEADLLSHARNFLRVGKSHVGGVLQVVAGAVVAEGLAVALVALVFIGSRDGLVCDRPAKIGVGGGHIANDDRGFHHGFGAAADDRHGVAQVALHTDGLGFAVRVGGDVFAIVAAEAAQGGGVLLVVWIGFPIQVHIREGRVAVDVIQGFDGRVDLGLVNSAGFVRVAQVLDGLESVTFGVVFAVQQIHGALADKGQIL